MRTRLELARVVHARPGFARSGACATNRERRRVSQGAGSAGHRAHAAAESGDSTTRDRPRPRATAGGSRRTPRNDRPPRASGNSSRPEPGTDERSSRRPRGSELVVGVPSRRTAHPAAPLRGPRARWGVGRRCRAAGRVRRAAAPRRGVWAAQKKSRRAAPGKGLARERRTGPTNVGWSGHPASIMLEATVFRRRSWRSLVESVECLNAKRVVTKPTSW